jgi:uncharacterized protein (DUF2147 family)
MTLVAAMVLGTSTARSQSDPSGIWLTQAGDAQVHVHQCGGGICGKIVWLRDPIDKNTGRPQIDDKNPNPALARRPVMGMTIFSTMQPTAANRWSGRIYNADDGQTYAANLTLQSANVLEVQGCMGALCGAETWRKVSDAPGAKKKGAK